MSSFKQFGLDDWFAIIAWVLFACHASFAIAGVYHGTGQHAWNIRPQKEIVQGLKWWWFCEPFYVLGNMAIKASIVIMLLRIIVDIPQRVTLYVTLTVVELYSTAFFLLFILQCQPSSYFWSRFGGGQGSCIDNTITVGAVYAYSAISCVGDWIFSIMPCVIVWQLQMRTTKRMMVGMILSMSAVASIATIARIPYVHTLANQADFLFATVDVAIWSCCEEGLAITASACATLQPLLRHFFGETRVASSHTEGHLGSARRYRSRPSIATSKRRSVRTMEDPILMVSYNEDMKRDRSPELSFVTDDEQISDQ